jgi:peptidoglycan-N-acetylglucosamine deacetylase
MEMKNQEKKIFYDEKKLRWRYSKPTILFIASFFAIAFSVTVVSIFINPALPDLNLGGETLPGRIAPGVALTNGGGEKTAEKNNLPIDQASKTQNDTTVSQENGQKPVAAGFYVNWDDNSFESLKQNIGNMDEMIPEWLNLGSNGEVSIIDRAGQERAMDFIKQSRPDLKIVPLINNYNDETQSWDNGRLMEAIGTADVRTKTAEAIYQYVKKANFSGISVDFEDMTDQQIATLELFMQELYGKFRPENLEVSQNIPLDDDSFNAKEMGKYCDYLILMAYDENSIGDTLAGPIASQNWLVDSLRQRYLELPKEKYILGVGGYGYDWIDGKISGTELTFQDAMRLANLHNSPISLDLATSNPTFDYVDADNNLHHAWFLDGVSAFNEAKIGSQLGQPHGYALWRMGSEDPTLWNVFKNIDNLDNDAANSLAKLNYGYDVSYSGQGEILKVTSSPMDGQREVEYDEKTGYISKEQIIKYPSSYVVSRWGGANDGNRKKIALTFDDGPDKKYTPEILAILKRYNVPGTFFVIGANANLNSNIIEQEYANGNEIGSHTYTHPNITKIADSQFTFELDLSQRIIEGAIGKKTLLFRPPYAEDIEPETADQMKPLLITEQEGYYTVGMHIDPSDWSSPGTSQIVSRVIDGAKSGEGNVVLLHDGGGDRSQTVEALPGIIEGLIGNDFELVSVSDLIGVTRDAVMPPISKKDMLLARVNNITISSMTFFANFMRSMFIIGIVLGTLRLSFIGFLALAQWFYSKRRKKLYYKNAPEPSVAVVIPAFNEEKVIIKTVEAILSSNYPVFEIIVVDDGSGDGTIDKLKEAFGSNPNVLIYRKENEGKAAALNFGIACTKAEIIITLDADTMFRKNTISKLVRGFVDRRVGAIAGNAKVGNRINLLTRWQALEYITSQNLDRRAFEIINCITVVPGAVGAWRRDVVLEAGGFSESTLAEDADLTFSILRNGYRVAYDDEAIAFTEAPDNSKDFIKQRFRWMFGTLQTVWKHRDTFGKKRYGALGFFALPNVLIFQIIFPLISPLMDLMMASSIAWAFWQFHYHAVDYSADFYLQKIIYYYLIFLLIDFISSDIPFLLEKKEDWKLLIWLPLQRFYYRQLMYYVAIKSFFAAIKGRTVGWNKLERKATVYSR